jgi:Ca2+-binding EF-hand superfamily protein
MSSSSRPSSARNYATRSPRGELNPHLYHSGQIDPATWWRLHTMKTNAKSFKERDPIQSLQFNDMSITSRPQRTFNQPSLPSPRRRPMSARGALTQSFLQQANNYPAFKKIVQQLAQPQQEISTQTAVTGEDIEKEVARPPSSHEVKRAWGELPPGVTPEDIRRCSAAIKEKMLDKFGTLTKAFRAIDEDGSSTITRQELDRYMLIINLHSVARPEVVQVLFELIDDDQSGHFDFKEFSRVMSAGDVMNMKKIENRFDGFQAKLDEEAAAERAQLEYVAKQAGMSVEAYQEYWAETNEIFGGAAHLQKASDLAVVARDRWGKKIKNGNLSALGG